MVAPRSRISKCVNLADENKVEKAYPYKHENKLQIFKLIDFEKFKHRFEIIINEIIKLEKHKDFIFELPIGFNLQLENNFDKIGRGFNTFNYGIDNQYHISYKNLTYPSMLNDIENDFHNIDPATTDSTYFNNFLEISNLNEFNKNFIYKEFDNLLKIIIHLISRNECNVSQFISKLTVVINDLENNIEDLQLKKLDYETKELNEEEFPPLLFTINNIKEFNKKKEEQDIKKDFEKKLEEYNTLHKYLEEFKKELEIRNIGQIDMISKQKNITHINEIDNFLNLQYSSAARPNFSGGKKSNENTTSQEHSIKTNIDDYERLKK